MNFEALYDELKDLVASEWPLVNGAGGRRIYEAEHSTAVPFDRIANVEGMPYAIVSIPDVAPVQMGLANRSYMLQVELTLIQRTEKGAEGLRPLLESMCATLRRDGLQWGTLWDDPDPSMDWSWDLEINQFLREKKLPALAGTVSCIVAISETD